MSDPTYQPQDFIAAEAVVEHLHANLAIQFQIEGDKWDRETMQKHVNQRAALNITRGLLLDEADRLLERG